MTHRALFSAFAAILLSVVVVQTAGAVPSRATAAVATVTGSYNPLDLTLDTLVNGTSALNFTGGVLSFTVDLTGSFQTSVGSGYSASGDAGLWTLTLTASGADVAVSANQFLVTAPGSGVQYGTLEYGGGLNVVAGALNASDTPALGDIFELYSIGTGPVFSVDCLDGTSTCNDFEVVLGQVLQQVGPFDASGAFDQTRANPNCGSGCGLTSLRASGVPEPATLALLGLGLAGLGLSRRVRARA
jgi:hypothetical protein